MHNLVVFYLTTGYGVGGLILNTWSTCPVLAVTAPSGRTAIRPSCNRSPAAGTSPRRKASASWAT